MKKRWEIKAKYLDNGCMGLNYKELSPLVIQLLQNRGFDTEEKIKKFLDISPGHLHSPSLLKDLSLAIDRLFIARKNQELVMLYGDYDVDGITSIVLLAKMLQYLGISFFYYHPNRLVDGYGFHIKGVNLAISKGAKLIITADCGTTDHKTVDYARGVGIDVIVTDHHKIEGAIPKANAFINPQRPDCNYPFKDLAGVGVVLKFVQGIFEQMPISPSLDEFFEIAALGTVADVVPITDENRTITKLGLDIMTHERINPGIDALIKISGIQSPRINCNHLGFQIGPRLNAAGRVSKAELATECLLASEKERVNELAHYLDAENMKRKSIQEEIYDLVLKKIDENPKLKNEKVLVISGHGWHRGVIGIVASKVQSIYYKPIIIISIEEQFGYGSARSIPGFNIFNALQSLDSLFVNFGGHGQAAGLVILENKIDTFRQQINEIADNTLNLEDLIPKLSIDMEINLNHLTFDTINQIEIVEPFSVGNPPPVFITSGCRLKTSPRVIGQRKDHLKFQVSNQGLCYDCVCWQMADRKHELQNEHVDIVYTPSINEWRGNKSIQLEIKDFR